MKFEFLCEELAIGKCLFLTSEVFTPVPFVQ